MVAVALLVAGVSWAAAAQDDEGQRLVPVDELPAGIVEVVKTLCPGGTITTAKREPDTDDDGKVEEIDYEIKVALPSGRLHVVEVDTTPGGKVKPGDCRASGPVTAEDLPKAVAEASKQLCPEGQLVSGEREARFDNDELAVEYKLKLALPGEQTAELRLELDAQEQVRGTRVEAPVAVKDLPKVLVDVLAAACPTGKIVSAEREMRTDEGKARTDYTLKVEAPDGKALKVNVRLTGDGSIRRIEIDED
jgi:hypothetical protein